ncbi:MAG: hypothetical protein U0R50_13070 [Gaiellales bacterium]
MLPAPSVALTWNVWEPSPRPLKAAGDEQEENEPASSEHVNVPSFAVNGMVAVELATVPVGPPVIETVGAVVSCTTTLNEPLALFPAASVATQLTAVVPIPKLDPETGEHEGTIEAGPSLAVAVYVTVAVVAALMLTVCVAGSESVGGVVSCTVITKLAEPVFPEASVAVQVTVVLPSGKLEPLEGTQVGVPAVDVALKVTDVLVTPFTETTESAGVVTPGAVWSRTTTSNDPVEVLPRPSVPVHETAVVPSENVDPEAGEQLTETGPLGSEPLAPNVTTALGTSSTSTSTLASESDGPVVSTDHDRESDPTSAPLLVARTVNVCEPSPSPE